MQWFYKIIPIVDNQNTSSGTNNNVITLKILIHGMHDQFMQIEIYWLGFLKKQTSTVGCICASDAKP